MDYRTVAKPSEAEIEISKSRFLGHIERVESEIEARKVIEQLKSQHPKARHHCTAFIIGKGEVRRSNDDGEPQGTGGAPILDALEANGLGDTVAIVTRYFGGVLLGASGLTRAYRAATVAAIENAKILKRKLLQTGTVAASYEIAPILESHFRREGVYLASEYSEKVNIQIGFERDLTEKLRNTVLELSAGRASFELGSADFFDRV